MVVQTHRTVHTGHISAVSALPGITGLGLVKACVGLVMSSNKTLVNTDFIYCGRHK